MLRGAPHGAQRKTRGRVDRYSFLVRIFHSLLPAGLSRRSQTLLPSCRTRSLRCIVGKAMPKPSQGDSQHKKLLKRRHVVVVVVPPVEELDLVGPMQVFSAANRLAGKPVYAVEVVTNAQDLKVAGEGGLLSFLAQRRFPELKGSFDSLLLVCGVATRNARDAALFAWLRKVASVVRRIGCVCVGAFLLAEAGLLNGKRATAHWKFGEELAKRYPLVRVESHLLWVKDVTSTLRRAFRLASISLLHGLKRTVARPSPTKSLANWFYFCAGPADKTSTVFPSLLKLPR